jgi:hypothetical protein
MNEIVSLLDEIATEAKDLLGSLESHLKIRDLIENAKNVVTNVAPKVGEQAVADGQEVTGQLDQDATQVAGQVKQDVQASEAPFVGGMSAAPVDGQAPQA